MCYCFTIIITISSVFFIGMSQSPVSPDFLPDSPAEPESGFGPAVKIAGLYSGPFAAENNFFRQFSDFSSDKQIFRIRKVFVEQTA